MKIKSLARLLLIFALLTCIVGLVPVSAQQVVGGDQGWYAVHCNVDGATVMFDNDVKGVIANGALTVPVYVTGTPYKTYTVSMNGYTPFTAAITQYPAKGVTVDLYSTLNPAATTAPTQGPLGFATVVGALGAAVIGLGLLSKKDERKRHRLGYRGPGAMTGPSPIIPGIHR